MLPLTFDRQILTSPSLMYNDAAPRILRVLRTLVKRRVLPWFELQEDVDPVHLARASERFQLSRMEDISNRFEIVSLVEQRAGGWTVHVHERFFDYIGFGLPMQPTQAFEQPSAEARKVLALAEFILRHEFDLMIRPHQPIRDVLAADCDWMASAKENEPALHEALMAALNDSSNGLRTRPWLDLLERFESGSGFADAADDMVRQHTAEVCEIDGGMLVGAFATLSASDRDRLLDACHRQASNADLPVARRAVFVDKVTGLLEQQRREDESGLRRLFFGLLERWPAAEIAHELGLLESPDDPERLFAELLRRLDELEPRTVDAPPPEPPQPERFLDSPLLDGAPPRSSRSLRDRVDVARQDPRVPEPVIRVIDNNIDSIDSQSKAKYTEFIETLLAVPWGRVQPIEVGPREFAAGLDAGHFGLERPKELVADFFSNLIWRYRDFDASRSRQWRRNGSAFLFVGPPGVGKTSLAISIAENLGLPYHKISLGGMRDESALRGHGFTYEGSKPGGIVQGLIKMESMNGVFILDEADKTETFAIATLLEILDPEQNHLFHDKYTQTTVDIDLSNCHFILTANTLDTVPAPVIDRCQVVHLDRYSVEEKISIASRHLLPRLRDRHRIPSELIDFPPDGEVSLLRFIIQTYTHEAGVRQLEQVLRTLLLRLQRRLLLEGDEERVVLSRGLVKRSLEQPAPPARINHDDRVGEIVALGVHAERGVGGVIPVQATRIASAPDDQRSTVSVVHATGNLEKVMDESRRVATTAILHNAQELGLDPASLADPVHLHFMGGSSPKDGPSAGLPIALALSSLLLGRPLRRDVAATGEIDTQGRVSGVGGLDVKLETAMHAGCTTLIIPSDNLTGPDGVSGLPEALRRELQVLRFEQWRVDHEVFDPARHALRIVAVDHVVQALEVAEVDVDRLDAVVAAAVHHAERAELASAETRCPMALLVKEPEELDSGHRVDGLCAGCPGCRVLASAAAGAAVESSDGMRVTTVSDPTAVAAELRSLVHENADRDGQLAVVAPYFTLQEAGLDAGRDLLLFANNYTVHGLKLKGCKRLLNRTVCRLLHLAPGSLADFPLMRRRDGIHVADLGLLPESLRLDAGRCEEVLNRALGAWLATVERRLTEGER
jgi:ATP-dependent Lon protease